jgi:chromate transporter
VAFAEATSGRQTVNFQEAIRFWVKLGLISFGGPTGQIAIMHQELVENRQWISESRFLHALNYCMLLPGPEAQQLAIYIGWLLHRTIGGIIAGAFFVLPSMFFLWILSFIYIAYGNVFWISSLFYGLKAAVISIVATAVFRIGKKALKSEIMWMIAAVAFAAIFFMKIPFPAIVMSAGIIGFIGGKILPEKFNVGKHDEIQTTNNSVTKDEEVLPPHVQPSLGRALKVTLICLILWGLPVLLIGRWLGWHHTIFREGIFFSKAAMVTFGGAYAVLPYVSQQAVDHFHWLTAGQMMDGLGLAETTPGPLIMVVQFIGFLGAWNHPGELQPLLAATVGALLTTWVTFVPCFLWIFLGAPHIEQLRENKGLTSTLSAITAAVVGVVLNLAVWFAIHAVFPREVGVDWFVLLLSALLFFILTKLRWDIVPVVFLAALLGLLWKSIIA